MMQRELLLSGQKGYVIPPGGYLFQVTVGTFEEAKDNNNTITAFGFSESKNSGNLNPKEIHDSKILKIYSGWMYSIQIELSKDLPISEGSFVQRLDTRLQLPLYLGSNAENVWLASELVGDNQPLYVFTSDDLNKTIPVLVVPIFA